MSPPPRHPGNSLGDTRSPVERTLSWADEAATRGDYRNALAWLRTVETIGRKVPPVYEARRAAWMRALDSDAPAG